MSTAPALVRSPVTLVAGIVGEGWVTSGSLYRGEGSYLLTIAPQAVHRPREDPGPHPCRKRVYISCVTRHHVRHGGRGRPDRAAPGRARAVRPGAARAPAPLRPGTRPRPRRRRRPADQRWHCLPAAQQAARRGPGHQRMARRRGGARPALLLHHRGRAAEPHGLPRRLGLVRCDGRRRPEPRRRSCRGRRDGRPSMSGTVLDHWLVRGYLRELDAVLRGLPAAQARELKEQISAHLDDALGPDAGDYEVAATLSRLGSPADLAAEAGAASGSSGPRSALSGWRLATVIAVPMLIAAVLGGQQISSDARTA